MATGIRPSLALLVLLAGCDSSVGATPGATALTFVELHPRVVVGSETTLRVRAFAGAGVPLSGATIEWTIVRGSGTLSTPSSSTNAAGEALVTWRAPTMAGEAEVRARVEGVPPQTVVIRVEPGAAIRLEVTPADTTLVGLQETVPLTARPVDGYGNRWTLPSTDFSWSVEPPGVGMVSPTGTFTSLAFGSGAVRASLSGLTGQTNLLVSRGPVLALDPGLEGAVRAVLGRAEGELHAADLRHLTQLLLPGSQITTLDGLEWATRLTQLDLRDNGITSLAPLLANPRLGVGALIDLRGNPLSEVARCVQLPTLLARGVAVQVSGECEEEVEAPVHFPSAALEARVRATLGKGEGALLIRDLQGITSLDAAASGVTDLRGLEHMSALTALYLQGNQIMELTPLEGLTSLEVLDLSGNAIRDIGPLSGLPGLRFLSIAQNLVEEIGPLVANPGLGTETTLDLRENILVIRALCEDIPTLQNRGITVLFTGVCLGG